MTTAGIGHTGPGVRSLIADPRPMQRSHGLTTDPDHARHRVAPARRRHHMPTFDTRALKITALLSDSIGIRRFVG
jgi:hypothetical protein